MKFNGGGFFFFFFTMLRNLDWVHTVYFIWFDFFLHYLESVLSLEIELSRFLKYF